MWALVNKCTSADIQDKIQSYTIKPSCPTLKYSGVSLDFTYTIIYGLWLGFSSFEVEFCKQSHKRQKTRQEWEKGERPTISSNMIKGDSRGTMCVSIQNLNSFLLLSLGAMKAVNQQRKPQLCIHKSLAGWWIVGHFGGHSFIGHHRLKVTVQHITAVTMIWAAILSVDFHHLVTSMIHERWLIPLSYSHSATVIKTCIYNCVIATFLKCLG